MNFALKFFSIFSLIVIALSIESNTNKPNELVTKIDSVSNESKKQEEIDYKHPFYKENTTVSLDCSDLGKNFSNINFEQLEIDSAGVINYNRIDVEAEKFLEKFGNRYSIKDGILTIKDLINLDFDYPIRCTYENKTRFFNEYPFVIESKKNDASLKRKTLNGTVHMICELSKLASRRYETTWSWWFAKDGKSTEVIANNQTILIDSNTEQTKLEILNLNMDNEGEYRCHAENKYGIDDKKYKISIISTQYLIWPFVGVFCQCILISVIAFCIEKRSKKSNSRYEGNNVRT